MTKAVARVGVDRADKLLTSGATTVYTNDHYTVHEGSKTMSGATVVAGSRTVFVENKPIARASDDTTKIPIQSGSTNVFAGG